MLILVTGGAGYLGAVLVPELLAAGHRVRVLDALRTGGIGLLPYCANSSFEFIHGDVCNESAVARALDDVDLVVHLAAVVGYPACAADPDLAVRTNIDGTRTLMRLRSPAQRFLLASTCSVYGPGGARSYAEDAELSPATLYASTKLEAEGIVLDKPNTAVFRYATGFGVSPAMRFDLLANKLVHDAVHRRRLQIYEGSFRRSFIHVDDMAAAVRLASQDWTGFAGETFNVGDARLNITKSELALSIAKLFDCAVEHGEFGSDADRRDNGLSFTKIGTRGFRAAADIDSELVAIGTAARLAPDHGGARR